MQQLFLCQCISHHDMFQLYTAVIKHTSILLNCFTAYIGLLLHVKAMLIFKYYFVCIIL
jgi:hypothetical protein